MSSVTRGIRPYAPRHSEGPVFVSKVSFSFLLATADLNARCEIILKAREHNPAPVPVGNERTSKSNARQLLRYAHGPVGVGPSVLLR